MGEYGATYQCEDPDDETCVFVNYPRHDFLDERRTSKANVRLPPTTKYSPMAPWIRVKRTNYSAEEFGAIMDIDVQYDNEHKPKTVKLTIAGEASQNFVTRGEVIEAEFWQTWPVQLKVKYDPAVHVERF